MVAQQSQVVSVSLGSAAGPQYCQGPRKLTRYKGVFVGAK